MASSLHHHLRSSLAAGVVAGLVAGVLMGVILHTQNMMVLIAQIVGTENLFAGWMYHLFNSVLIGALFGLVLGRGPLTYGQGLLRGTLYGLAWWVVGGLILMPFLLGMPVFAPLRFEMLHDAALLSLVAHLVYGVVLGVGYTYVHVASPLPRRRRRPAATTSGEAHGPAR